MSNYTQGRMVGRTSERNSLLQIPYVQLETNAVELLTNGRLPLASSHSLLSDTALPSRAFPNKTKCLLVPFVNVPRGILVLRFFHSSFKRNHHLPPRRCLRVVLSSSTLTAHCLNIRRTSYEKQHPLYSTLSILPDVCIRICEQLTHTAWHVNVKSWTYSRCFTTHSVLTPIKYYTSIACPIRR